MKVWVIRSPGTSVGETSTPPAAAALIPGLLPARRSDPAADRYHCLERQIAMLEGWIQDLELKLSVQELRLTALESSRDPY